MSSSGKIRKKLRPVYNLRNKKAFDHFIENNGLAVIVVYHYICPQCERYLPMYKKLAAEFKDDPEPAFGKIHLQLHWMIEDAHLTGDVEEENVFLKKYKVGKRVPATLFFRSGHLIWKIEGILAPAVIRGLVSKLQMTREGADIEPRDE